MQRDNLVDRRIIAAVQWSCKPWVAAAVACSFIASRKDAERFVFGTLVLAVVVIGARRTWILDGRTGLAQGKSSREVSRLLLLLRPSGSVTKAVALQALGYVDTDIIDPNYHFRCRLEALAAESLVHPFHTCAAATGPEDYDPAPAGAD